MKGIHPLIIASSVEPSKFQVSDSLRSFLKMNQLDGFLPHIVQVTQSVTCRNELLRLHAQLMQLKQMQGSSLQPLTLVFTSPAAVELLASQLNDQVCVEIMEAMQQLGELGDKVELAGVGPTTTARIKTQWGATGGIRIHPPAATEGLQACLQMIGLIGGLGLGNETLAKRSVMVLGAAAGTSQRVTAETLHTECFYAIYENVTVPNLEQILRKSVTEAAAEASYCACVCQSGAAVRAIIQVFEHDQSGDQERDQTKFVLFPRGASAILALKRSRLPAGLLSCEDIGGSAPAPDDSDPTKNT
jgi:hypothetical protein